ARQHDRHNYADVASKSHRVELRSATRRFSDIYRYGDQQLMTRFRRLLSSGLLVTLLSLVLNASAQTSQWVSVGPDGKLQYKTLPNGDHIMDFSWAGYMGGGVALPIVPVKVTVNPSGGDD